MFYFFNFGPFGFGFVGFGFAYKIRGNLEKLISGLYDFVFLIGTGGM